MHSMIISRCLRRRLSVFFLYRALDVSMRFFVFKMVSWSQWYHLHLKSPFSSAFNGIGFMANGPEACISRARTAPKADVCDWNLYANVRTSVHKSKSLGSLLHTYVTR